jgi:hypothetical protein
MLYPYVDKNAHGPEIKAKAFFILRMRCCETHVNNKLYAFMYCLFAYALVFPTHTSFMNAETLDRKHVRVGNNAITQEKAPTACASLCSGKDGRSRKISFGMAQTNDSRKTEPIWTAGGHD